MALKDECFECNAPAEHAHHPIPRVRGGTKTIPLCTPCHGLIHEQSMASSQLVKEGIAKARANGTPWGKKRRKDFDVIVALYLSGVTYRGIAKQLGIHEWAVKGVLSTYRRNKA